MKKKLINAFIICCYVFVAIIVYSIFVEHFLLRDYEFVDTLSNIVILGIFVMAIVNIVAAIVSAIRTKADSPVNTWFPKKMLMFKLVMIPIFILNFFVWFMLSTAFLMFGGAFLWIVGAIFAYILMLASSAHVIAELIILYKMKRIRMDFLIIHSVLQLIFCVDVIGYLIMYKALKKIYGIETVNNA